MSAAPARLTGVRLGLGLTQLGRPWGHRPSPVPSDAAAHALLACVVDAGVQVLDTAPSYGASEARLGAFLGALAPARRDALFVATKCGETWDEAAGAPRVAHDHATLCASIERSLARLGRVDLLQTHRMDAAALRSRDVRRALARARALGVGALGASVSDPVSARVAVEELGVTCLQFPYHAGNAYMAGALALAADQGCAVLVNRSLGMGRLLPADRAATPADVEAALVAAYRFVLAQRFDGAVLTGTAHAAHLLADVAAFRRALADAAASEPSPAAPRG